jgi:hypothetical protein
MKNLERRLTRSSLNKNDDLSNKKSPKVEPDIERLAKPLEVESSKITQKKTNVDISQNISIKEEEIVPSASKENKIQTRSHNTAKKSLTNNTRTIFFKNSVNKNESNFSYIDGIDQANTSDINNASLVNKNNDKKLAKSTNSVTIKSNMETRSNVILFSFYSK